MKNVTRSMNVTLNSKTTNVIKGYCNCPAARSGYCNHVMALLFEIADYSLHQLKTVPDEVACTSKKRQWGVPTETVDVGNSKSHDECFKVKPPFNDDRYRNNLFLGFNLTGRPCFFSVFFFVSLGLCNT